MGKANGCATYQEARHVTIRRKMSQLALHPSFAVPLPSVPVSPCDVAFFLFFSHVYVQHPPPCHVFPPVPSPFRLFSPRFPQ
mmetsp:Transcript_31569/g.43327  ORF Transcript_31569/g.43327 Transcript_31569/m.43327 type:complete len:82 (-) Transcript_31569:1005-1250(-)